MHQEIINKYQQKFLADSNLAALLVTGSVARGENKEFSDLDLIAVGNYEPRFEETKEDGITVEIKYRSLEAFKQKIDADAMNAYQFIDAKLVCGDEQVLVELKKTAEAALQNYKPELGGIIKLLTSSQEKLKAANEDELKASFVINTTLWKLVEGLYAVNKLPVPPSTTAYRNITKLVHLPKDFESLWNKLLLGSVEERSMAFNEMVEFVVMSSD